MKFVTQILAIALTVSALSLPSFAETIRIPLGQQGKAWNVETPRKGLSMNAVEAQFGVPMEKSEPIGDPAIYTWEYNQFKVIFEGDYVIHSVVKASK